MSFIDLTSKRMFYARYGVEEFWFVSGGNETLIQMTEPENDDYTHKVVHEGAATVTSRAFPEVAIRLGEMFRNA